MSSVSTPVPGSASFRGWRIVAVAFFANGLAIGLTTLPYGLFTVAIGEEFGASLPTLMAGLGLMSVVMAVAGPIVGPMLDRYSIRAVMVGGAVLLATSFALMSIATAVWQLGVIIGLFTALGVAMLGPLATTTVVAKWFERKRGRAVGIVAMGIPALGIGFLPLTGLLLESVGWRVTLRVFALVTLLISPFVWGVVRNRPEDEGHVRDGSHLPGAGEDAAAGPSWTTAAILRAPAFWILTINVGMVFGMSQGQRANFPTFAVDLGYSVPEVSVMFGFAAGVGLVGTPLFGYLADFLENRALLFGLIAGQAVGLVVYMTEPAHGLLLAAVMLIGFTGAGMMPVYATLLGRIFGPATFGKVIGMGSFVMLPFSAGAPSLVGWSREATGRYVEAFGAMAVAFLIGGAILILLRKPQES